MTSHEPPSGGEKPPGIRELTPRSVICGLAVAAVMGASYPYVVLKLGFGPNVSVVAAFFGYLALGIFFRGYNRWENNMVQTAGTAGAQTAFMCVLLAAFDMLAASKNVDFKLALTPLQSFAWLTAAGLLGVLLAVPMRRHFIVDEKLTYADGVAAGETLIVLDGRGTEGRRAAAVLAIGAVASAILMAMNKDSHLLKWFPATLLLGSAVTKRMGIGIEWSLLAAGSGMLVGLRITFSMLIGAALAWIIAPYLLINYGLIAGSEKIDVLLWIMWPAIGMLVAGGLTALGLRWRTLVATFRNLSASSVSGEDFPLRWVAIGVAVTGTALVVIQKVSLGLQVWVTVTAILLSVPLMLVGLRVLGETNWGPITALSHLMQCIFGLLVPGNLLVNMTASGTTGTIAVESEALMQDYKAGHLIGSTPRNLTIMQLVATPVGAAAVSWMYPLLRETYGIAGVPGTHDPTGALSSPGALRLSRFAEVLSQGFAALPAGALWAFFIGAALGIVFTVLEGRGKTWVPSPTGLGMGMLVPAAVVFVMFLGSLGEWIWRKLYPESNRLYMTPLASGLIAGEAIVAVVVPLLFFVGLLHK